MFEIGDEINDLNLKLQNRESVENNVNDQITIEHDTLKKEKLQSS